MMPTQRGDPRSVKSRGVLTLHTSTRTHTPTHTHTLRKGRWRRSASGSMGGARDSVTLMAAAARNGEATVSASPAALGTRVRHRGGAGWCDRAGPDGRQALPGWHAVTLASKGGMPRESTSQPCLLPRAPVLRARVTRKPSII